MIKMEDKAVLNQKVLRMLQLKSKFLTSVLNKALKVFSMALFGFLMFTLYQVISNYIRPVEIDKDMAQTEAKVIGIDVRSGWERSLNPAEGSIGISRRQLAEILPSKLTKENVSIKVFCEAGPRAQQAKRVLKEMGFKDVENIRTWRHWNKASEHYELFDLQGLSQNDQSILLQRLQ